MELNNKNKIVKILRYFKFPDLISQTPMQSGIWGDYRFIEDDSLIECDYLLILDHPSKDTLVRVNPACIFHISLEPPNEISKYRQYNNSSIRQSFTQLKGVKNGILSHGALPWHLDRDFDFLKILQPSHKEDTVVWVTSNQFASKGHFSRMNFLNMIKNSSWLKLYGRGFSPIPSKFDVLYPSKYAIAYENFASQYYWSEKIVDAFLSWCLPFYFGCSDISNFFHPDSYIQLDPSDKYADLFIKECLNSKEYESRIDLIRTARQQCLYNYQLFPFISSYLNSYEIHKGLMYSNDKTDLYIKGGESFFDMIPLDVRFNKKIKKIFK